MTSNRGQSGWALAFALAAGSLGLVVALMGGLIGRFLARAGEQPFLGMALLVVGLPSAAGVESLPSPAGPSSGEPFLTATESGTLLSWLETQSDTSVALRFARWDEFEDLEGDNTKSFSFNVGTQF